MKSDSKFHVFHQVSKEDSPRLYSYGSRSKKYTEKEVDQIISLLPKDHHVIRVIWCETDEYLHRQRDRAADRIADTEQEFQAGKAPSPKRLRYKQNIKPPDFT